MALDSQPEGLIKLRLTKVDQLFNSLDPSPFHERDFDADAEEYIVAWARELPGDADLQICRATARGAPARARAWR
jgi:hypothetical protein